MTEATTYNLLFVCTGNTCRSPMAEALARRLVEGRGWSHVRIASAGVAADDGLPASRGALEAASVAGLDLSDHRSRPVDGEIIDWADLVLTMGSSHLTILHQLGAGAKASLLGDFAVGREGAGEQVPDPFGADLKVYRETLSTLSVMVNQALDRIAPIIQP